MELGDKQKEVVIGSLNDLFYSLAVRFLGHRFKGPKIFFTLLRDVSMLNTLDGIYRYTLGATFGPGLEPDEARVKKISDITGNFIESQRLKTINQVLMAIDKGSNIEEVKEEIQKQMIKATSYIDAVINTEIRFVQASAEKQGIETLGASLGIDDPTVVKLGVTDERLCKVCKKLWHTEDNIKVPKAYKLSELKGGYCDHKDPEPTEGPSHPHCRHVLSMVPPNFGFDDSGRIKFKHFGYDYYSDQQGIA